MTQLNEEVLDDVEDEIIDWSPDVSQSCFTWMIVLQIQENDFCGQLKFLKDRVGIWEVVLISRFHIKHLAVSHILKLSILLVERIFRIK